MTMTDTDQLTKALAEKDLRPTRLETMAFHSRIGEMDTFTFQYAIPDLADLRGHDEKSVAIRKDFDLDDDEPGNRPLDPHHVNRIAEGLFSRPDTPIQLLTLAVPPTINGHRSYDVEYLAKIDEAVSLVRFRMFAGAPAYIENGQHTLEAIVRVWERVRNSATERDAEVREVLARSTAPVQVIIEGRRDEINRIFVVAALTKPISPALMTALDQTSYANRLGTKVGRKARLLTDEQERLVYLRSAAGEDSLYSTAHVRGFATSVLIGFKDRTPVQREANIRALLEKKAGSGGNINKPLEEAVVVIVGYLDYAYETLPGWRQLRRGHGAAGLSPKQFRTDYLHGTPAGLYVIGGVLGAARFSGVSTTRVIDELAKLEWGRSKYVVGEDKELGEVRSHPLFEGLLVRNEKEIDAKGQIRWVAATAGGARTNYEAATLRILNQFAAHDETLKPLIADETLKYLGLRASAGRGRRRKITPSTEA